VIETSTTIQTSDGSAAARGLDVATGGYLRVKRSTSALELVGGPAISWALAAISSVEADVPRCGT
jgi:hypothetical protein